MKVKDFFKQWFDGTKSYAASMEGKLTSKLFFLFMVFIGLFMSSLIRLSAGDLWMFIFLFGLAGIFCLDIINSIKQLMLLNKLKKGGKQ